MEIAGGRGPGATLTPPPRSLTIGAEPKPLFRAARRERSEVGVGRPRLRNLDDARQNNARAAFRLAALSTGMSR